tara:strand:- start:348 stop:1049 length:702 start_codon:yes stop_codon:yes gene_type:complete
LEKSIGLMIVGGGLVANSFKGSYQNDKDIIIFASGVSNSSEIEDKEFNREKNLLNKVLDEYPSTRFIYLSTILIGYKNTPYYIHKENMEKIIMKKSKDYVILRVPQLIGYGGNKKTLVNYMTDSIKRGTPIIINNEVRRSIVDIEDIVKFVEYCKEKISCATVNISGVESISVIDLCKEIGYHLRKSPLLSTEGRIIDNGWVNMNSKIFKDFLEKYSIVSDNYTIRKIKKYIS